MTGGRASRQKGNRLERALGRALQDSDFAAERVPLSGAAPGASVAIYQFQFLGVIFAAKSCRGNGFRQLYEWLNGADLLIVRADSREPLVVIPFRLATEIAQAAERAGVSGKQSETERQI